MGRHNRHKKSVWTGLRVMTPIEELSGESRSPTPVNETARDKTLECQKNLESGDTTPKEENHPSSDNKIDDSHNSVSFSDHIQGLVEDYTGELITKGRQLRQEREVSSGLWIEYLNFRTSWLMDQAEKKELKNRLAEMKNKQRETNNEMAKMQKKLEEEHGKLKQKYKEMEENYVRLKASFNDVCEKNQSMKKMESRSAQLETERSGKTSFDQERKLINFPTAPVSPVRGQGRPYTGRSRDEQMKHLPPITDNNKVVVLSPEATSPLEGKQSFALVHLPPIPCPAKPMVPAPPKLPRPSNSISGRRHSRIPLALPQIRGASSVGNVRDEGHDQKQERGIRNKK